MSPDARLPGFLLHAVPFGHSEASDPWIVIGLTTLGVLTAVLAGLVLADRARRDADTLRAARGFAAGALLFLFFDLVKEAASLGQGLVREPLLQLVLVAAFVAGLIALALPSARGGGAGGLALAWAWALGIAAHGAGEAWVVGTEALTADITAPAQATSFLLHKIVEGFTIPLVAGVALSRRTVVALSAVIAAVALVAATAGHLLGPGMAPLVLFALGAGATGTALLWLAKRQDLTPGQMAYVAVGVVFVYLAGMLHEF